jgi:GTP diphosphokinase / guanosine-3',5'-bis(diphosphate) 3'-diphosphatase
MSNRHEASGGEPLTSFLLEPILKLMSDIKKLLRAAAFSAKKHTGHVRKGANAEPYINHPIEVANILSNIGKINDVNILAAALLHDTVEDTETTPEEIEELFGTKVRNYVMECTDDKTLPKARRKELQVEHAPHLSPGARQIKLADKISNITDIMNHPPDWSTERKLEYIQWGADVVAGLRGANKKLERLFDETVHQARAKLSK